MVFHIDYGDGWFFLITCTTVTESTAKRVFKKTLPPEARRLGSIPRKRSRLGEQRRTARRPVITR